MASDRQRPQGRRNRPPGAGARAGSRRLVPPDEPAVGPSEGRPPDADPGLDSGLVDPVNDGSTPAPDPLKHASAEVDQARLAEAGAMHPDQSGRGEAGDEPLGEAGLTELPDADLVPADALDGQRDGADVDGDYGPARSTRAPDEEEAGLATGTSREAQSGVLAFLRHCIDELRRVQWPNRRQVGQATAVVLGFVVLAGGYLGLLDAVLRPLINAIL